MSDARTIAKLLAIKCNKLEAENERMRAALIELVQQQGSGGIRLESWAQANAALQQSPNQEPK